MSEATKGITDSIVKLVIYIVLFIAVTAVIDNFIIPLIAKVYISAYSYSRYVDVLLAILFGYLIISAFSQIVYWNMRIKHDHGAAAAVRNVFRIIGVAALVAAVVGSFAGAIAGVALGGFLGIVIGMALASTLGQLVSGLILLISRPFKIHDRINLLGDDGKVIDVTAMYTFVERADKTVMVYPNNIVTANKVYVETNMVPPEPTQPK